MHVCGMKELSNVLRCKDSELTSRDQPEEEHKFFQLSQQTAGFNQCHENGLDDSLLTKHLNILDDEYQPIITVYFIFIS